MFDSATLEPIQTFTTFKEAMNWLNKKGIAKYTHTGYIISACKKHTKAYGYYWSFNTFIETDDELETLFGLCEEE